MNCIWRVNVNFELRSDGMKKVLEYDLGVKIKKGDSLMFRYYSASPFSFQDCIYYVYGMGILCCKKISLNGEVSEVRFAVTPEYRITWQDYWRMFVYEGHVTLACGVYAESGRDLFLDLDLGMEPVEIPDEAAAGHGCWKPGKDTEDICLGEYVMHYKNSRSFQCLNQNGEVLWEEKHKGYLYTAFEKKNGCVLFGTAGHGGGLYCYRLADGECLCAVDTKGTPVYCWQGDQIVCRGRNGELSWVDPFGNCVVREMRLDSRFTDFCGYWADERYVCAVGFREDTNSPCVYLIDCEEEAEEKEKIMMKTLELAKVEDIEICSAILESGRQFQQEQGFVQWTEDYPNIDTVREDVKNQKGYVIKVDGKIAAYMCIDFSGEPAYLNIEGKWRSEETYAVVHRMAFGKEFRGIGLSDAAFELIEAFCLEHGVKYIRIDTDFPNKRMQHILMKNGFEHCGVIVFQGSGKMAYDKLLEHGESSGGNM